MEFVFKFIFIVKTADFVFYFICMYLLLEKARKTVSKKRRTHTDKNKMKMKRVFVWSSPNVVHKKKNSM